MEIIVDEKIPFLEKALTEMGHEVRTMPGSQIVSGVLGSAEVLFVRTRTKCDESLLHGSQIKFIGTATIGYDHIDADYCLRNNIYWCSAPGCNADAVLQYVQSSIYLWVREKGIGDIGCLVLGIVGVGEIGRRVNAWAQSIGMRVLLNDPPREEIGHLGFEPLESLASQCDIITFHPTLTLGSKFSSYHLADDSFFSLLEHKPLIINASRGEVVDNYSLKKAIIEGMVGGVVLDVWENEPNIDLKLLEQCFIATPHIAGYSAEGKVSATVQVLSLFAAFTKYVEIQPQIVLSHPADSQIVAKNISEATIQIYNPLGDTERLKNRPGDFEELRNDYVLRRDTGAYNIELLVYGERV